MSGNTFNLIVGEGGSIDVTVAKVDSTFFDVVSLYVQTIRLRTSLSSDFRIYRIAITQPSSLPTGYTGAAVAGQSTWLLLSDRTSFVSSPPSTDPHDGTYTFTSTVASSLIGTQQVQPHNVSLAYAFTLETSTNAGSNWTVVPFSGTGTNYTFDIGDGTNRRYDTSGVENTYDSGNGGTNAILQNNQATLYYKPTYNPDYPSAPLTNGISTVDIAGSRYTAYLATVAAPVTPGNDFTLYLPNSANSDGPLGVTAVQDRQTIIVPYLEANLMDLGPKNGLQEITGTVVPISKTVERGDAITLYAVIPWNQVTIDSIEKTEGVRTAVNSIPTSTYYSAFLYEGTTYTLSIVPGLNGTKNVKMVVQTSYGSTVSTTIHRIWIRIGTPGVGTAEL